MFSIMINFNVGIHFSEHLRINEYSGLNHFKYYTFWLLWIVFLLFSFLCTTIFGTIITNNLIFLLSTRLSLFLWTNRTEFKVWIINVLRSDLFEFILISLLFHLSHINQLLLIFDGLGNLILRWRLLWLLWNWFHNSGLFDNNRFGKRFKWNRDVEIPRLLNLIVYCQGD